MTKKIETLDYETLGKLILEELNSTEERVDLLSKRGLISIEKGHVLYDEPIECDDSMLMEQ